MTLRIEPQQTTRTGRTDVPVFGGAEFGDVTARWSCGSADHPFALTSPTAASAANLRGLADALEAFGQLPGPGRSSMPRGARQGYDQRRG